MNPKPKLFHLPPGLNKIALGITCFFGCCGLMNITNDPWIKSIMLVIGLYCEYEAQYLWGLSFTYKKLGRASWYLKSIYIGYVIVFGLMSGIGFFATEISVQETAAQKVETSNKNNQDRISQLRGLISDTREDMNYERDKNHGTGDKYQGDKDDLKAYNDELTARLNPAKETTREKPKAQAKDMFANLSKTLFGIPKNILIIIMFGYALSIVFISLAINPVEIPVWEVLGYASVDDTKLPKFDETPPDKTARALPEDAGALPEHLPEELFEIEPIEDVPIKSIPEHKSEPIKTSLDTKQKMIIFAEALYDTSELKDFPMRSVKPFEVAAKEAIDKDVKYRECSIFYEQLKEWGAIKTNPGTYTKWEWPLKKTIDYIVEMEG